MFGCDQSTACSILLRKFIAFAVLRFAFLLTLQAGEYNQASASTRTSGDLVTVPETVWFAGIRLGWKDFQVHQQPHVIRGMPMPADDDTNSLVAFIADNLGRSIKLLPEHDGNSAAFAYFTADRPWASDYHLNRTYLLETYQQGAYDALRAGTKTFSQWHMSLQLPTDSTVTLLGRLSPMLAGLMASSPTPTSILWLSSPLARVSFHYDMYENIFHQISGEKTFELYPPKYFPNMLLHPSSHPHWRQSQGQQRDNRIKPLSVHLSKGDVLYIPPFYYHRVIAGNDSVSVNAWLPSSATKAYDTLLKAVGLPFAKTESTAAKTAALGAVIRLVLHLCQPTIERSAVIGSFAATSLQRYLTLLLNASSDIKWIPGDLAPTNEHDILTQCLESAYKGQQSCSAERGSLAEANIKVQRIAKSIHGVLFQIQSAAIELDGESRPLSSFDNFVAIRHMLLMDYIEEILGVIVRFNRHNSFEPCDAIAFMSTCVVGSFGPFLSEVKLKFKEL